MFGDLQCYPMTGLDGPEKALRDAPPPAQRGFTQADQVNQLVWASEVDADIGFMARLLALCSLPRSNPGDSASVPARQWSLHTHHDRNG